MFKGFPVSLMNQLLLISLMCFGCSFPASEQLLEIDEAPEISNGQTDASAIALVRKSAHKLSGKANDYDPLLKMIGDARFVMLGEATHGTHEFYRERARITQRLIEEKGFDAVVLEADWADAYRVNEFVRGSSADSTAEQSLAGFTRFPRWMWRNRDFRDLVASVRSFNDARRQDDEKAGIYGMDLYGLKESSDEVIEYLNRVDKDAANRARKRYGCLSGYRDRPEQYGYDVSTEMKKSCEAAVSEQFQEMENRFTAWLGGEKRVPDNDLFSAYQNARVVKNAEAYYRLSYKRNFSTWNLRDSHMADTLQALSRYLDAISGQKSKIVVWAHNTHQGDAQMTEMGEAGELNVGHLMRKANDGDAVLVGFTTNTGQVLAASEWGGSGFKMKVRRALPESYSNLFHQTGVGNFLLIFRGNEKLTEELAKPRLERAIGVIYKPETERQSHYFTAKISKQFDAVIHFDTTNAVQPF
jgi:erythromycin esterase-like protein